ncbi:MAG: HK97-gp10 family putative phage morphogenesis protein [Bacillaceae bacterium]
MRMKANIKIKSKISQVSEEKQARINDVVSDTLLKIQAGAKQRSPVDTGHMKRNIKVEMLDDSHGKVGTKAEDVEYAHFVEFGTSKQSAQPFLFPAAEDERPNFHAEIKKVMSEK